ncbi:Rieske (2Fe-2S) protein [Streptomyces antimicrobicus]|uniref:Cytochrome bc1 complex Rieske iron-sulfur subunit n=1 Tax=Streptomyces antimicrobicus TaxID=2883108 RepID=A0ABS8B1A9_9ACTN|nr:Rieske (2Fe-2S) protein [Streptomyces antimicrobicus]MCB5178352.1 Rieske (2Fe-2S) protein [Streptomyces antimicrobicus]
MADQTTRRTVLAAGAATLAGTALSGCGGEQTPKEQQGAGTAAPPQAAGSPQAAASPEAAAGAKQTLGAVADIPVGGGKVFKEQKVVVTQPKAGEFKAFSAVCTHQGCAVSSVKDGHIVCPCHQSLFKVADGSVAGGPATRPLPAAKITVDGGTITLA